MTASTVPVRLSLALAFLFPDSVLLFVFSIILLGSLAWEHLALHCDIHTALLGHQEVFDLPGHAAISQHENNPVGTHHESTGWQKKETQSKKEWKSQGLSQLLLVLFDIKGHCLN